MGNLSLLIVLPLIIGLVLHLLQRELERMARLRADWKQQMQALGLDVLVHSQQHQSAQGPLEGVQLQSQLKLERENKQSILRSTLTARRKDIPRNLELLADSVLRSAGRLVEGTDDHCLGDPEFDQRVELPVLDAYVCAALSHQARQRVLALLRWRGRVQQGQVTCQTTWTQQNEREQFPALLRNAVALARLLSVPPESLHQRLAQNALKDPEPAVRLQNLRFLVAAQTQTPPELLAGTARSLLADVHAVRLLAAQQLGAEGHGVLRALAADRDVRLQQRLAAAHSLGQGATPDLEGLRALLQDKHPPELRCAALAAIPRAAAALLDSVVRCTRSTHEVVRAAAARALGVLAQPHSEPVLLRLLSDDSSDVQQASAEALGGLGTVAAVAPLLPLAESLLRPQLRAAARGAIGRIQARLGDVEAGRVSLAQPQELAGAVALADTPAAMRVGELSLTGEEPPADAAAKGERPAAKL